MYGMTLLQYESMLAGQGGVCKICKTDQPGGQWNVFAVDHDHATGAVRGLLCAKCNAALGALNDDIGLFLKAIDYLVESRS
jgi:hypothetical protein